MPGKKHVLVIDDEEMLLDLVGSSLEETAGYSVTAVADGESGLKAIRASPPDLVLLDLGLRGMSGWEVIDRLKDHPSPPPVIVMSGDDTADVVVGEAVQLKNALEPGHEGVVPTQKATGSLMKAPNPPSAIVFFVAEVVFADGERWQADLNKKTEEVVRERTQGKPTTARKV